MSWSRRKGMIFSFRWTTAVVFAVWLIFLLFLIKEFGRILKEPKIPIAEELKIAEERLSQYETEKVQLMAQMREERLRNAENEHKMKQNMHRLLLDQKKLRSELSRERMNLKKADRSKRNERAERVQKSERAQRNERKKEIDTHLSQEHEIGRRKLERDIWELFYYLDDHHTKNNSETKLKEHGSRVEAQMISLLATARNFSKVDGTDKWRKEKLSELTQRIQRKIEKSQNPGDCSEARALICNLNKGCGFGCQLHHVVYCLITAFGASRTMVLENDGYDWAYSGSGWSSVFLPISACSYKSIPVSKADSFSLKSSAQVVSLGIIDTEGAIPDYLPLSFPASIKKELLTLHANPPVFFLSQFIWYLMRENRNMSNIVQNAADKIPFGKDPIVGWHVRRTDKLHSEAQYHSIEEYMKWTELWYGIQEKSEGRGLARRVFIATDDPTVVPETRKKYPNYRVYGDVEIAKSAQTSSRYTDSSLHGVVTDIRLLSMCDYIVCTFSSQICRMSYELKQVLHSDSGENVHSLDDIYYFGGQLPHSLIAIEDHKPLNNTDEIEIKVGDVLGIAGNHWNGWSKGTNRRTGTLGLFPSYKAIEDWRIVDMEVTI